ncbi:hypothetical protein BCR32DRAFT_271107 [Anaeromyces robustus]|uniref:RGS domain-containing protein n=1 Tax=Anaeromyces robustus TaxID=1754192 RepID=A0A1Y1WU02_9FUNG|nr:hypothetical protein BCR32DRAFT_271107 [Anaeromyces robustus]|eukprot:ORX76716.1 hypothetical protein BCR32DRAFT_271107 [Anaeromyces robustus]
MSNNSVGYETIHSMISGGSLRKSIVEIDSYNFNIANPMGYYKRLEKIIKSRITIYYVIFPLSILLTYNIIITIQQWKKMIKTCPNELKEVTQPKLIINVIIYILSIYMFYQAYINQKWDIKFKIEYTTFIFVQASCLILMQFAVNGKLGDNIARYRVYIFQFYAIIIHLLSVIEPLIEIYISKHTKKEEMLNEEEFLNQLSNITFKEQVTELAIRTFCIENLIFIEAHNDLMNTVLLYYKKKNLSFVDSVSFGSSDILHKNKINPILYQPFDPVFKSYYENVYNFFIKEGGIASVNIESTTISDIELQIENDDFSYLMFIKAVEEVGELLFNNIYPKLYLS